MNKRLWQQQTNRVFRRARLLVGTTLTSFLLVLFCVPGASFGQKGTSNLNSLRVEPSNSNERTTFWLLDEDGSWRVPLPNWTVDEVAQIVESREDAANVTPYSIRSVDAIGAIKDDLARLTIQIEINVNDDVVRVPLGLQEGVYIPTPEEEASGAALSGGFSYEGPGYCFLDVDPKTGEYVATIQTPRSTRRRANGKRNSNVATSANSDASQTGDSNAEPDLNANPTAEAEAGSNASNAPETPTVETPVTAPQNGETPTPETPAPQNGEAPTPETPAPQNGETPTPEAPAPQNETSPTAPEVQPAGEAAPATSVFLAPTAERYALQASEEPETTSANASNAPLNSPRSATYRLTLELCFTIESIGADEYVFAASFPPSAGSQLALQVPLSELQLGAVAGAAALTPSPLDESSTEIKLRGLGRSGERTEVSWRKSSVKTVETQIVYQVENAAIRVELSPRETFYDVSLPIRAFGGETDVFYVELPPNATLISDEIYAADDGGSSLDILETRVLKGDEPIPGSDSRSASEELDANASIVEVRLAKSVSYATLRLKARVSLRDAENATEDPNSNAFRAPRSISGFSVSGATKQYGTVRTTNTQELDFSVVASYGATLSAEESTVDGEECYRLYSQPFQLLAQAYERKGVVNVKPEYQFLVGAQSAKLHARFQYAIYGEKIKEVEIDLRDWTLSDVEKSDLVDVDAIKFDKTTGEVILPLKTPSDGEIVVELTANRDLNGTDDSEITMETPNPAGDWVESAILLVAPDDNVSLEPTLESCTGLTPKLARSLSPGLETPKTTQKSEYYLARQNFAKTDEKRAASKYVARMKRLPQEIEVKSDIEATVSAKGETKIRQTFVYDIKHEPIDSVLIKTPSRLLELSGSRRAVNLKYFLDGKPVPPQNLQLSTDDDNSVTRRVLFETPRIGSCELTVQYDGSVLDVRSGSTTHFDLDLMQPEEGKLLSNVLTLVSPVGIDLSCQDQESKGRAWKLVETTRSNDGTTKQTRYNSEKAESGAHVNATLKLREGLNSTIVERAWIQSWFSDGKRVDRAAYRILCDLDFIEIYLPPQAELDRVALAVDGKTVGIGADAQNGVLDKKSRILRVSTPKGKDSNEFTLELSYVATNALGSFGRRGVQFPRFVDSSVWVQRMYWQVLTPFNFHIVNNPRNWTPEFFLKQSGAGIYSRIESTTQDELCEWIGAERRRPVPDEVNSYLFSCFDKKEDARFYLLDRATLVLIGSGSVWLLGLGLIYFPFVRSRGVLLTVAVIVLTLGAFHPTFALIFLQTTAIGVGLTLFVLAFTIILSFGGRAKKNVAGTSATVHEAKD